MFSPCVEGPCVPGSNKGHSLDTDPIRLMLFSQVIKENVTAGSINLTPISVIVQKLLISKEMKMRERERKKTRKTK